MALWQDRPPRQAPVTAQGGDVDQQRQLEAYEGQELGASSGGQAASGVIRPALGPVPLVGAAELRDSGDVARAQRASHAAALLANPALALAEQSEGMQRLLWRTRTAMLSILTGF